MRLYTIYDSASEEAGYLFEAKNDKIALRNFSNMLVTNKVDERIAADYTLWFVGDFNNQSMVLSVAERYKVTPVNVAREDIDNASDSDKL